MRFLHLADVHLDTPFAGRSAELRRRLRSASREAFAAAVDLAIAEDLDAVLVAGDLFDGERLSFGTELFLLEQLARLGESDVPVVYARGNHDPAEASGRRRVEWPANVTVVDDGRPRRIALTRSDGTPAGYVTAAGHATARETRDLARAFPEPPGGLPEVALLHTQVLGARGGEAHDPYAPARLPHLLESGYHYWALGHVHERQCLSEAPAVHYPGNLQGRTPRERGAKGGLLVDLSAPDAPRVEFRPFAPVRFETLQVRGLEGEATLPGLLSRVQRDWHATRRADADAGGTWIVRVVLSGPTPLARELEDEVERAALARELCEAFGALDVDLWTHATHPVPRAADHRGRQDVLGEALRLLDEVRAGRISLAGLHPAELAGPDAREDVEAYVRRLLEDAEGEILARLLADGEP